VALDGATAGIPIPEETLPPAPVRWVGFVVGPAAAISIWWTMGAGVNAGELAASDAAPGSAAAATLSREGVVVLALMAWMACWWLTQAVELATTALLPLIVFPLTGVTPSIRLTAAPYANEVIFLFAGGCLLAQALERHGLSRRVATAMLSFAGARPTLVVGTFLLTATLLSAFVSNTATAAMLMPLALAAANEARRTAPVQADRAARVGVFGTAVLLAVAYGASIGGGLTLIGSPPNAIAAQALRDAGTSVTFASWLRFSAPLTLVFLPVAWLLLTRVLLPVHRLALARSASRDDAESSQPWSRHAIFTTVVFAVTVTLWVGLPWMPAPLPRLQDGGVAVLAGVALLAIPLSRSPSDTALSWRDAARLPWSVLILFGGGLCLADAMDRNGVALWLSRAFHHLEGAPEIVVIGAIVVSILFLTELASNTAVAATACPVLLALGPALDIPVERLVIPAAFAASWAFMLPVGTPPNALVYATGRIPAARMARVGLLMNIAAAALITMAAAALL